MSIIYEYIGMAGTEKCFNRNPTLRKIYLIKTEICCGAI
jgi:hypothetical protein